MILFKGREREIIAFYTLSALIAVVSGYLALSEGIKAIEGGESVSTAVSLFLYVLIATASVLLLIYLIGKYIRLIVFFLELFFLFLMTTLLFSFINGLAALSWALLLTLLRALLPDNQTIRNVSVSVIAGVSAGILGISLSPVVALTFYVLLLLYDFVSVFITGHMVKMAKSVEDIDRKGDAVALGAGDLVVPMILSTSLLPISPSATVGSLLGAAIGLYITLSYLREVKTPLPALPFIGAVQLTLTALSLFLSTPLL